MTSLRGLDSISRVDPRLAISLGYEFILRYVDNGVNSATALSDPELETYELEDFGVGGVYEMNNAAAAGGANAGAADARVAVPAYKARKAPHGAVLFYGGTDTDPAGLPGGISSGVAYYRGVAPQTRGEGFLVGGYVRGALANACLDAGVVDKVLSPAASSWSDGAASQRVDVDQQVEQVTIGGASYDVDLEYDAATATGLWTLSGLWPKVAPAKPKPPAAKGAPMKYGTVEDTVNKVWYLVAFPTATGGGWPWKLALASTPDSSALVKFVGGAPTLKLSEAELSQLPTVKDLTGMAVPAAPTA